VIKVLKFWYRLRGYRPFAAELMARTALTLGFRQARVLGAVIKP
jgi:hypothetical protein